MAKVKITCVICGEGAIYILKETKETLCEKCMRINEEIRRSKIR